jgi:hypothetical protein
VETATKPCYYLVLVMDLQKNTFNLEAAKAEYAKNPLFIDRALSAGFGEQKPNVEISGLDDARRNMFLFFQNELFSPQNLASFKKLIENDNLGHLIQSHNKAQENFIPRNKHDYQFEILENTLNQIDLIIRKTMIDHYYNPLVNFIDSNKHRVAQALRSFNELTILGPLASDQDIIETCKHLVKGGFNIMISIFLGLVRILPRVMKRQNINLSEEDFKKVINNIQHLLKRYSLIHFLKLIIFRDHIGYDSSSESVSRNDGMGTTIYPAEPDKTPDLYHFHADLFDLIDTDKGKQLVNNVKLLEEYRSFIEDYKIRGKRVSFKDQVLIDEIMTKMHTTATLGCPLGRVKFDDGKNFIEVVSRWVENLLLKYYVPVARVQGLFNSK